MLNNQATSTGSSLSTRTLDLLAAPAVYLSARLLGLLRRNVARFPTCKNMLLKAGTFPIRDHYYEPLFNARHLTRPLSEPRRLPGLDLNVTGQLELLSKFSYRDELLALPLDPQRPNTYYFNNPKFGTGDAEYLYNLIRLVKPKRLYEIGSGFSTLMAIEAINANRREDSTYTCDHCCVEPYEMPWLSQVPVRLVRTRVEELGAAFFDALAPNDILFIDSSHVIRPQGDVVFEFLELLPTLSPGVIVHIHDIFTPRDYPKSWVVDHVRLWNEQYLLEAFLCHNHSWKIVGALNFLYHEHRSALGAACPQVKDGRELGSFYIQRIA